MKRSTLGSVTSLLTGMAILLAGSGLIGTLLGLRAELEGFSETALGLVMSAFFLGFVLGAFVCPVLIRRVGHIRTFAAMAALSAAVALLYGLLVDPLAWWLLRLINGVALVGLYMVVESWLNQQADENRGQVFAVYMMISLLALAAGQWAILLYGPADLASFALVAILFCIGLLPIALMRASQPAPVETPHLPFRRLFHTAPAGVVGAACSGAVTGAFWGLAAVYAVRSGLGANGVAAFISLSIVGGAVLQWPIGRWSDHRDRRAVMAWVALAGALAALLLVPASKHSALAFVIAGLLYGGFAFSLYGLSVAQTHDRLERAQAMEGTKGLLLINGVGAALGPIIVGLAMQYGGVHGFPLALATLMLMLAGYTASRIRRSAAVPECERTRFVALTRTSAVALDMDPRLDTEASPADPSTPADRAV